jgi:uncharacterized protein (DUF2336 family)
VASEQVIELLALAKEKSQSSRNQLVENITDLFLSEEGRLSEHERALMSDILTKLIHDVEESLRKALAAALAKSDAQLPDVVRMLAEDEIDIARPLLEKSKLLKDKDLIHIVRMRTDEHRLSVAIREGLSTDVSDALMEYGSHDVIETLLRNPDAALSLRAKEYIVAESRRVDRFQEPLVGREDLPADLAYKMYWWVSAALRKKIMDTHEMDPVFFDTIMQKATNDALVGQSENEGAILRAQKLVRRLHQQDELTHNFLMDSLRQQKIPVFVAGLSEKAGVDYDTAWHVFNDKGFETLAIMAKGIGIDRSEFSSMYLLISKSRDSRAVSSPQLLRRVMELFDSIDVDTASGALQYWRQNKEYQLAMEELDNVGT